MRVGYMANNVGIIPNARSRTPRELLGDAGGNLGNLVFWYAARKLFINSIELINWNSDVEIVRSRVDLIVLPAANFLNASFDLEVLANLIEAADKPVLIWGLGAQSNSEDAIPNLRPGTQKFLHEVAKRTENIFVRGEFTASVCRHYGVTNIKVAGCPSLFLNADPTLGEGLSERFSAHPSRLYVAGATYTPNTAQADLWLLKRASEMPGSTFVIQDPAPLVEFLLEKPNVVDTSGPVFDVYRKLQSGDQLLDTVQSLAQVGRFFTSVPDWVEAARRHDHAISTRIHGAVVAMSAGVPSVVVGHDARVRELASTLGLPQIDPSAIDTNSHSVDGILQSISFDGARFDANRKRIAAMYDAQLIAAGLTPAPMLSRLASAA